MPKKAKELSAVEVKRLTKSGLHAVGGVAGLLLQVRPTGSRSWILRVKIGDRRRDIGLGGYPDVPLAQAREKARQAREQIAQGIDPVAARQAARIELLASQAIRITFDEATRRFLASKRHEFRNAKHTAQWSSTLKTYASPVIGKLPVSDIELGHILRALEAIWHTKTETAKRVRGRIEAILAWAAVHGYRTGDNPARWKGHLEAILPKPSKIAPVIHHKALAIDDMGRFVHDLRHREGMAAKAVEFTVLTAARSGEVRGATWAEIDMTGRIWTIPAERMKAGREHRIPLSKDAVTLLEALPRDAGNELVFTGPSGGKLSENTLTAVLKRMGVNATVHGFRSTFRDWCGERTSSPHEVAEMALAHTIKNKAEAAYRRGDLLKKRARLMEDWAQFCNTTDFSNTVLPFGKAQAI